MITGCHSLSLDLTCWTTRFHSLPFVVTRSHLLYHSFSLVAIRCHSLTFIVPHVFTRFHSLSLDVSLVCLFINDRHWVRFISFPLIYRFERKIWKVPLISFCIIFHGLLHRQFGFSRDGIYPTYTGDFGILFRQFCKVL